MVAAVSTSFDQSDLAVNNINPISANVVDSANRPETPLPITSPGQDQIPKNEGLTTAGKSLQTDNGASLPSKGGPLAVPPEIGSRVQPGVTPATVTGGSGMTSIGATQGTTQQTTSSAGPVTTATPAAPIVPATGMAATYNPTLANGSTNVAAGTATAGQATATQAQLNPATDTVAGQVNSIIDENSPLMQQAVRLANQRSNARGMINSSQGVGAASEALYTAATPIATSDAAAYNQQRLANQSASNQASIVNAQLYTDVSKFNVDEALKAGIVNKQQADQIAQFNANSQNQASQFNAASGQDMAKFNIANLLQAGIINQDQANKMSMFNADQVNQLDRLHTDIAGRIATANIGASATVQSAQIGAQASMANAQLSAETQRTLGQLDATTRTNIANIQAENSKLINTNNNASSLYQGSMNNIANIMNNPNLTDDAKQTAISNITGGLNNGLKFIGALGGVDLGKMLDFGPTTTGGTGSGNDTKITDPTKKVGGIGSTSGGGMYGEGGG